ncbi:hypothetical protein [Micromonospora echinofusca]|uniref:hypothetical protein n=1 Tax=Micromonospora echinofusca TaxID=47858 RepID=UPI0012FD8FF8|nr:hypothetical protein [Micromonospora echinofusca]
MVINPGTQPVENSSEATAAENIEVFVQALHERGIQLSGPATRDSSSDRDGRYGYLLPTATSIRILMPGVELTRVRDDLTASAPCLFVNDRPWWWSDAVKQAAGAINVAA